MLKIRNIAGRKLDFPNGYLRRQIEIDRCLNSYDDVHISYDYYEQPKSKLDHLIKRVIKYPRHLKRTDGDFINNIIAQHLSDLALVLDPNNTVITCLDICNFLDQKGYQNGKLVNKFRLKGLRKCNNIIAISEFTKREVVEKLGIDENKIEVIKCGVNRDIFYPIKIRNNTWYELFNFNNYKTILHFGTESGRKNFITLLRAFYLLKKEMKDIKLIRVGKPEFMNEIKILGLEKDVIYLTDISNTNLNMLYNQCNLFVFPSVYEGYGLPGMEAISAGCPLVCSDIPVFREIYGGCAVFFGGLKNDRELSRVMYYVLQDMNENVKKETIKKGIELANKNKWKKFADQYYNYMMRVN